MAIGTATYIIIGITAVISFLSFNNSKNIGQLILYPSYMNDASQYYRFFSHGLIHANPTHLLFNMLVLFFFGPLLESYFAAHWGGMGTTMYFLMYIIALAVSSIPAFYKHRTNPSYRALGASGATSAVLFATILFGPWHMWLIYFIIPMPAILAGALYLYYEYYQSKKGNTNIGHDAHITGALFGMAYTVLIIPSVAKEFVLKLISPPFL